MERLARQEIVDGYDPSAKATPIQAPVILSPADALDKPPSSLQLLLRIGAEYPPRLERRSGLGGDGKMKSALKVAFCIFVMILADHTAHADGLRQGRHHRAAASLLLLPARQGDSQAQARLCFMYTYGRGVPQSDAAAASWCDRAANQGNSEAQYMLGLLYNKGHGVPEDFIEAYKWLDLAAAARGMGSKHDFSYRIRDAVATKMSPDQIAIAQALAIAWRPRPELRGSALIAGQCAGHDKCLER